MIYGSNLLREEGLGRNAEAFFAYVTWKWIR
jgi:hypothetical protein